MAEVGRQQAAWPQSGSRLHAVQGAAAIAQAISEKDDTRLQPSRAYAVNLLGLSQQVPAKIVYLADPSVSVKTMEAARTFWEKATILHQMAHLPEGNKFPDRYSRHYCDLAAMIVAGTGDEAAKQEDLLDAVVHHKIAFYRSAWAHYDTAKRGTLRLLPAEKNMDQEGSPRAYKLMHDGVVNAVQHVLKGQQLMDAFSNIQFISLTDGGDWSSGRFLQLRDLLLRELGESDPVMIDAEIRRNFQQLEAE